MVRLEQAGPTSIGRDGRQPQVAKERRQLSTLTAPYECAGPCSTVRTAAPNPRERTIRSGEFWGLFFPLT